MNEGQKVKYAGIDCVVKTSSGDRLILQDIAGLQIGCPVNSSFLTEIKNEQRRSGIAENSGKLSDFRTKLLKSF